MQGSSRDLSNTAFARAYDRPIFGPYGSGNIQPAIGGGEGNTLTQAPPCIADAELTAAE